MVTYQLSMPHTSTLAMSLTCLLSSLYPFMCCSSMNKHSSVFVSVLQTLFCLFAMTTLLPSQHSQGTKKTGLHCHFQTEVLSPFLNSLPFASTTVSSSSFLLSTGFHRASREGYCSFAPHISVIFIHTPLQPDKN